MIDTGEAHIPKYVELLRKTLVEEQAEIEGIVITHWHDDHVGGIKDVQAAFGLNCPVYKLRRGQVNPAVECVLQ